jgi:ribonuclease-3
VRAHLVREDSLHKAALQLHLPEVLRMSEGEAKGGGAAPSILADAMEAVIGAVYLDGGLEAQALVQQLGEVITSTTRQLAQGRQDRTAGMAAGPPAAGAVLPHRGHPRAGPCPDLRGRVRVPSLGKAQTGEGRSRRPPSRRPPRRCWRSCRPRTACGARD